MRFYSFKKTYLSAIGLFFLVILLHYFGYLNYPENKIRDLFLVALKAVDAKKQVTATTACVSSSVGLDNEILTVKNKLLEQENSELHVQLNFKNQSHSNLVTAQIVAKNLDMVDRVIILDKGTNDGIKKDQPVVYGNGVLIGKIIKTEDTISFARILSDNESKIGATIMNSDHSLGIVEGGFGLSIKMVFIPRNENIITGDQIITSGLEMGTPRGLLIGKVAAVENESYQPFQQAIITPEIDYEKINLVSILIAK